MVELKRDNLLKTDAQALVNTVNCVGVMGKGIALQFKQAFPENFKAYEKACRKEEITLGKVFTYQTGSMINPKYIINFPTKKHWRCKSKLADIQSGLQSLVEEVHRLGITSIAIPPLGCGYGGLKWSQVHPIIESAFSKLSEVDVFLFEPKGAPQVDAMPVRTKKPKMTLSRALFVKLLQQYAIPGYRLTLLEIQKLAYFLQAAGQPLRLNYNKHKYGPYAENLNFVLQQIEGHYIRGYGDRSKGAKIYLLPDATEIADKVLSNQPEAHSQLNRVGKLIDGFETPYGMELLASVHWVATNGDNSAITAEEAIDKVLSWSRRKKLTFKPAHIRKAWNRLETQAWLSASVN